MRLGRLAAMLLAVALSPALAGCALPGGLDRAAAAGGFSATDVFPGAYATEGPFSRVLEAGALAPLPDEVVTLTSALDGAPIQIGLVLPDVPPGTRVPVIASASIYLPPLREGALRDVRHDFPAAFLVDNFVPHGYAVAFVAARGTSGSGGCWEWYGPRERADLDQAVTWLGTQAWSSGSVGMIGRSFDGNTQWGVAGLGNPHLRTIVPVSSEPNMLDWVVRNGTVSMGAAPFAYAAQHAMTSTGQFPLLSGGLDPGRGARDPALLAGALCPELAEAVAASLAVTATSEPDPFGVFAERDLRTPVEANYRGSVLLVHGLQDFFAPVHVVYPWAATLEERGVVVKHLLGQWEHVHPDFAHRMPAEAVRWDYAEILLRWFDHWLKGEPRDLGPRVQVQDSAMRWRREDAWPPRDARAVAFHLAPGGRLASAPVAEEASVAVVPSSTSAVGHSDFFAPGTQDTCPACAYFATEPLERGLRFAGLPQVHLTVTPTGPGGHVTAYLYVDDASGTRQRVGWGTMDLRFADGGRVARAVTPGEPLVARMELEPLDVVVPPGARLVLALHQGGYGHTYFHYRSSAPTYPVQVEVGGEQSALRVHAFERGGDVFFTPPG